MERILEMEPSIRIKLGCHSEVYLAELGIEGTAFYRPVWPGNTDSVGFLGLVGSWDPG